MIRRARTMQIPCWFTISPNNSQPPLDATKFANNAATAGIPDDGSLIGTGLRLNGQKIITIPASPSLAWSDGAALTWSAWINLSAAQPDATIFSRRDGANAFRIGMDGAVPFVEVTGASGTQRSATGAAIAPSSWHHFGRGGRRG